MEICKRIIKEGDEQGKTFVCKVSGVKSKQMARSIARSLSCSYKIKSALMKGKLQAINVMHAVCAVEEACNFTKMQISIGGKDKEYIIYGDGRAVEMGEDCLRSLMEEEEVILSVDLREGNFKSTGLSCFSPA